jgi:hypothetical protein
MQALQNLVESGRIVDLMLAFIFLEIVVLGLIRQRRGGGVAALPLIINIGAGVALMLALRFALTDSTWLPVSACLLAALAFHGADVALRWERPVGSDHSNR